MEKGKRDEMSSGWLTCNDSGVGPGSQCGGLRAARGGVVFFFYEVSMDLPGMSGTRRRRRRDERSQWFGYSKVPRLVPTGTCNKYLK